MPDLRLCPPALLAASFLVMGLGPAASQTKELDPNVKARGSVTCLVRDREGRPVPGAEVRVEWRRTYHVGQRRPTDAKGRVSFSDLPEGRIELQAFAGDSASAKRSLEVGGEWELIELELLGTRSISGVVQDEAGAPIAGAKVRARAPSTGRVFSTRTDAKGRFRIERVDRAELDVNVKAKGFQALFIRVAGDETKLVLVPQVGRDLVVRGKVAAAGLPKDRQVEARLESLSGAWTWWRSRRLSGDRLELTFKALPPELECILFVRVGEHHTWMRQVRAGQKVVDFEDEPLKAGRTVRGEVEDPTGLLGAGGYSWVRAVPLGSPYTDWLYKGEIEPDGTFELRGLPAGPVQVRLSVAPPRGARQREWATGRQIVNPGVSDVTVVLSLPSAPRREGDALEVTITHKDGYLATLGFQTGDLIVGVDGTRFSPGALYTILRKAGSETGRAPLDVLRGDERLEVFVDQPRSVLDLPGSVLEPVKLE